MVATHGMFPKGHLWSISIALPLIDSGER